MAVSCKLQVNAMFSRGSFLCGLPKPTVESAKFCVLPYNTFDPSVLFPLWVMQVWLVYERVSFCNKSFKGTRVSRLMASITFAEASGALLFPTGSEMPLCVGRDLSGRGWVAANAENDGMIISVELRFGFESASNDISSVLLRTGRVVLFWRFWDTDGDNKGEIDGSIFSLRWFGRCLQVLL